MFIISSNPDGYGIDRCLEAGAKCGAAMAAAYCKTQQFVEAASFRKVERGDITGSIPDGNDGRCKGGKCKPAVLMPTSRQANRLCPSAWTKCSKCATATARG